MDGLPLQLASWNRSDRSCVLGTLRGSPELCRRHSMATRHLDRCSSRSRGHLVTAGLPLERHPRRRGEHCDLHHHRRTLGGPTDVVACFPDVSNVDDGSIRARKSRRDHPVRRRACDTGAWIGPAARSLVLDISRYRDVWYQASYLFDQRQTEISAAHSRFKNFKRQDLQFHFKRNFSGKIKNIIGKQANVQAPVAAIIREKGVNGDREMAYALHLAGFRVKDIHMTDLISGREDLSDVGFVVFVGGFSNSDVLGSAKGWAGAFLYNAKARKALDDFYERNDTLSLGVCNGCQLMMELGLVYPDHPEKPRMLPNDSGKFESGFINVNIHENNSVMLESLAGQRLGAWVAHGEGKFSFPYYRDKYCIPVSYSYEQYPGNPNGSDWGAAAVCSNNGRHLVMMPHLERSIFPWQWAFYAAGREKDEACPWLKAFVNAGNWLKNQKI